MKWSSKDILAKHNHFGKEIPKVLKIVKEDPSAIRKLHVGDSVVILKNLRCRLYDNVSAVRPMLEYAGQRAKITSVETYAENRYKIDLDGGMAFWSSEMFERTARKVSRLAIGSRVVIRVDLENREYKFGVSATIGMVALSGTSRNITNIRSGLGGILYTLSGQASGYSWTDDMFEDDLPF